MDSGTAKPLQPHRIECFSIMATIVLIDFLCLLLIFTIFIPNNLYFCLNIVNDNITQYDNSYYLNTLYNYITG